MLDKIKQISLLFSGALIGAIALNYEDIIEGYTWALAVSLVLFFLIAVGLIEGLINIFQKMLYYINKRRSKIVVLAPWEIDTETSSWVELSRRQFLNILRNDKTLRHKKINSYKFIKLYPVVINPYGGVYPEDNASDLRSLEKIFEYVKQGGIYVNVADIPFYYAYDKKLHRFVDTTPMAGPYDPSRSFLNILLTKKLHVQARNTENKTYEYERAVTFGKNENNFYQGKLYKEGDNEFSPFITIPYGRGRFIFSTFKLKNDDRLKKIIEKIIKYID